MANPHQPTIMVNQGVKYLSMVWNSTHLVNFYTHMCAKICNFAAFFIEYKRPRH